MADKDDRDTSLSGRSSTPSRSGSSASNARSDTPSSGRSTGSQAGSSSGNKSTPSSTAGRSTSTAGAGRGTSIGGPSISGPSRSSTAGGNTTARSGTGGIGSDRVASATPAPASPSGYGFKAPNSSLNSGFVKDALNRVNQLTTAPLSARPSMNTANVPSRLAAPATVAGATTIARAPTTRAQMDVMETLRQASTLTPSTVVGAAGTPTAGYRTPTQVAEETARAAGAQMDRYAQELAARTAPAAATEPRTRGLGAPVGMSAAPISDFRAAPAPAPGISPDSLPSSVAAINNAKMAQSDEFSPSMPAPAPGNRVGFGAYTGTNLPGLDASRLGPNLGDIQRNAYDVQRAPDIIGSGRAVPSTVSKPTPPGGVGYGQTLDEAAAQVALNGTPAQGVPIGVQLADNKRSRSPAVDVLAPTQTVAANTRSRSPGPATVAAATQPDYVTAAFQPQPTDKPTRQATPEQVAELEETGQTTAPAKTRGLDPATSADAEPGAPAADQPFDTDATYKAQPPKQVTATGRVKDWKPTKRDKAKGFLIDAASSAHPVGWVAQVASYVATGNSLGETIAGMSGGKYGPNQYKQGSQDRGLATTGDGAKSAQTSTTKPAAEPRPNTNDEAPGTTFEEKYLAFNDPTWRPTPIQKWGEKPTYPEYS